MGPLADTWRVDLTIITAVGRVDPHLADAAQSVARFVDALAAKFPDIKVEWVLACDAIPAATVYPLIAAAAKSVDIRVLAPAAGWHEGPARTRNRALAAANGRFVATLDTDDLFLADGMVSLYEILLAHPEATWAAGRLTDISPLGFPIWDGPTITETGPVPRGWFVEFLVYRKFPPFSPCASIVKREALAGVGGWDTSITYARAEDLAAWARVSLESAGVWLDEQVYEYRQNPRSVTHSPTWGPKNADNPQWLDGFVENLYGPIAGTGNYEVDLATHALLRAVAR